MIGPIMKLMEMVQRQDNTLPRDKPSYQSLFEQLILNQQPRPATPPFRDPMQAGPSPPVSMGPISQLYRGR